MGPHVAALFVSPEILTVEGFPELVGAIAEDGFFLAKFRWKGKKGRPGLTPFL